MLFDREISGYGIALRSVAASDADYIVKLRNMEHARSFISDTSSDVEAQRRWIASQQDRLGDYYFIVNVDGRPVGTAGLYNVLNGVGETGRWIVQPGSMASVPCAVLLYRFGFETLNLERLIFSVVSSNGKVISFHRRYGARQTHIESAARIIAGSPVDFVWFEITREAWPAIFKKLNTLAMVAERNLTESSGLQ